MESNTGTVEVNNGEVAANCKTGTVETNNNTVVRNDGSVNINNNSIGSNNAIVKDNNGTIEVNNDRGTVQTNNDTVRDNNGTVQTNNKIVQTNNGTVESNKGTIGYLNVNQQPAGENNGTVKENDGEININNDTVETNNGIITANNAEAKVEENNGIVVTNLGTVEDNFGSVTNADGGSVTNADGGSVTNNYGTMTDGKTTYIALLYEAYKGSHSDGVFEAENGEGQGFDNKEETVITLLGKTFSKRGCKQVGWKDANGVKYGFGDEYILTGDSALLIARFKKLESDYKTYAVLEGAEGVWDGADEGLSFVIDCPFKQFQDVKAGDPSLKAKDLAVLDPSCYEAKEGDNDTTVITLLPAYLNTLTSAQRVMFRFGDGAAYASFGVEI